MKPQAVRRRLARVPADAVQIAIRMRDGVLLATDVYVPSTDGPFDTVLSRLPYDKGGSEFFMPDIARYWRARGFAVVVQDVRGKARSGGDFEPVTPDRDDAHDTIEWIVAQPWSSGKVVMVGDSYAGATQWGAAATRHPALVCLMPRCSTHDRRDVLFDGEVLGLEAAVYWSAETAVDEYLYDYPEPFDWSARPVGDVIAREVGPKRPGWIDSWALSEGSHQVAAPRIAADVPVLHLCGLFDFTVGAQLRTWQLASTVSDRQYLLLDAVDHSWRGLVASGTDRVLLEPMAAFLERYNEPLEWFASAALTDAVEGLERVRWRPALDEAWRVADDWPPSAARARSWWLGTAPGEGHQLRDHPQEETARVEWIHDPADPVPSRGSQYHELAERCDLADLALRDDVQDFYGAVLTDVVELAGVAVFNAVVQFDGSSATLVATLLDVTPDGRFWEVRTGRRRVRRERGPQPCKVTLGPVAYQFLPGHRIGLRLTSSFFPRLSLDSGNETNTWDQWQPTAVARSVTLGGAEGAVLRCHQWVRG